MFDFFNSFLKQNNLQTIFRYLIIGGVNTIVAYLLFAVLVTFKVNHFISLMLVTAIVVLNGFYWHKKWTFESRSANIFYEFFRYNSVIIVGFLSNIVLLYIFTDLLKFDARIVQIFCMIISTILNYLGHRFWSFNRQLAD